MDTGVLVVVGMFIVLTGGIALKRRARRPPQAAARDRTVEPVPWVLRESVDQAKADSVTRNTGLASVGRQAGPSVQAQPAWQVALVSASRGLLHRARLWDVRPLQCLNARDPRPTASV